MQPLQPPIADQICITPRIGLQLAMLHMESLSQLNCTIKSIDHVVFLRLDLMQISCDLLYVYRGQNTEHDASV